MGATILKWIGTFILEKIFGWLRDTFRAWQARRALAKRDEEALKKHEEVIKKPDATDVETGESFEDTLNSQ